MELPQSPTKDLTCLRVLGTGNSQTALTFDSEAAIFPCPTIKPKYSTRHVTLGI